MTKEWNGPLDAVQIKETNKTTQCWNSTAAPNVTNKGKLAQSPGS